MKPALIAAALLAVLVDTAAARPPRLQVRTGAVTPTGTYLQCDLWSKYDTKSAGFPKLVKGARDCYFTQFAADGAAVVSDQAVCVPSENAYLTGDGNSVCASGGWVVFNSFTAHDKKGYLTCKWEAILDPVGDILQVLTNTCGF